MINLHNFDKSKKKRDKEQKKGENSESVVMKKWCNKKHAKENKKYL